jgi:mycothiol synthase
MLRVRVARSLTPALRHDIDEFLDHAHALGGARLSDHLVADLAHGPRDGFIAVFGDDDEDGTLVGYAQASSGNDGSVVGTVVSPQYSGDVDEARLDLLSVLLAELPGGDPVTWWSHDATSDPSLAAALGLQPHRALLQMRRSLPLDDAIRTGPEVAVRGFEVGRDEAAWLEVNNAAFAWHGEQGGWDLAVLQQREREPWFDPAGFLLHHREGRLAAFCWTKVHASADPTTGEIYVIAVHPDFHGLGLGRALTVAGLRHLAEVGATEGMLYVDADNHSAVGLYRQLGFEPVHTDRAYRRSPEGKAP